MSTITALHFAIFQGRVDEVRAMIERGHAGIDTPDMYGQTPLHLACYKDAVQIMSLLIEHGANLQAKDVNGNSLLMACSGCGAVQVAAFLLERGMSVHERNNEYCTAQDVCEEHCPPAKKEEMRRILKEAARLQELVLVPVSRAMNTDPAPPRRYPAHGSAGSGSGQPNEDTDLMEVVFQQLQALTVSLGGSAQKRGKPAAERGSSSGGDGAGGSSRSDDSDGPGAAPPPFDSQSASPLLTLVEANIRLAQGQKKAIEEMQSTAARLESAVATLDARLSALQTKMVDLS